MLWESQESHKPLGQLSLQHTYAGITFGDNWVCAYKAHVDQTGAVFPYARRFDFARQTKQGTTPNRGELLRLAVKCWRAVDSGGQIDYSHFLVCFPQWACTTRDVTVQMPLKHEAGIPKETDPVVEPRHIERLADRIASGVATTDRDLVPLEIIPHYYVINGRRRMSQPVNTPARALKLKAHVTLAERSCVDDILHCLEYLGIRHITACLSPFSAMQPHLSLVERQRNVAIVEVDRKSTCYSIYRSGDLVRSGHIQQGSYNVLIETAHKLGTRPIRLAKWLNEWEHVFVAPSRDGLPESLAFSRLDDGPKSLQELNNASVEIGTRMATELMVKVRDANLKLGTRVSDIVLTGEDYLSLRALKAAVDANSAITTHWRIPVGTHPENGSHVTMPGLVRTFGALKLAGDLRLRPVTPIVREYNRTRVDLVNNRIYNWGLQQHRRVTRIRPRHVVRLLARGLARLIALVPCGRAANPGGKGGPVTGRITLH